MTRIETGSSITGKVRGIIRGVGYTAAGIGAMVVDMAYILIAVTSVGIQIIMEKRKHE